MRAGSIVDINAHNHGIVDESFFTPFHLLMYSGVAANGLFYLLVQFRNLSRGHSLLRALPREYLLSFVGVLLFGPGGVLDFIWHALFGVETSIDALVSPSHLLLFFSGLLFMSGPLRSFLAGDWLLTRSSGSSPLVMLRRFAIVVPFLLIFSLFVILQLSATIWWNTHLWPGVSLLAGAPGLVLGALLTQGEVPAAD